MRAWLPMAIIFRFSKYVGRITFRTSWRIITEKRKVGYAERYINSRIFHLLI